MKFDNGPEAFPRPRHFCAAARRPLVPSRPPPHSVSAAELRERGQPGIARNSNAIGISRCTGCETESRPAHKFLRYDRAVPPPPPRGRDVTRRLGINRNPRGDETVRGEIRRAEGSSGGGVAARSPGMMRHLAICTTSPRAAGPRRSPSQSALLLRLRFCPPSVSSEGIPFSEEDVTTKGRGGENQLYGCVGGGGGDGPGRTIKGGEG